MTPLTVDANVWMAAFDPHDRFHDASRRFLIAAVDRDLRFTGPALMLVEVACALARRANAPEPGLRAMEALAANPRLTVEPMSAAMVTRAAHLGTERRLRSADAFYAATAEQLGAPLVSWDGKLVDRAGAVTPDTWLDASP